MIILLKNEFDISYYFKEILPCNRNNLQFAHLYDIIITSHNFFRTNKYNGMIIKAFYWNWNVY